jgi:hypothetical protein
MICKKLLLPSGVQSIVLCSVAKVTYCIIEVSLKHAFLNNIHSKLNLTAAKTCTLLLKKKYTYSKCILQVLLNIWRHDIYID